MSPKEKAIELTNKFVTANIEEVGELAAAIVSKECAIIAVDEIINQLEDNSVGSDYWYDVKQEIEKL
jgi:hypothetical protein